MKKRLLMQLLVLACAVGAYAENVGDYLFTASAKYQVTGANIFVNGDFKQGVDATWTNEVGGPLSGDIWGVETNAGPNGENALQSKGAKSDAETWLHFVQPLSAGKYAFRYYVKAPEVVLSSIVATPASGETAATAGANAVRFFLNKTGDNDETDATIVAGQSSFTTEWTSVVYTFDAADGDFFVFNACNIASGTQFTNFEIYPVVEVYDTRIAERQISYMESLLSVPEFTQERESIEEYTNVVKAMLEADDPGLSDALAEADQLVEIFLDANAGNLVSTTVDGVATTRYLRDWSTIGFVNWNNMSTQGTWSFTGGRWGFAPNVAEGTTNEDGTLLQYLERPQEDGYVASAGIQTSYELNVGLQIVNGTFANTSLKPGKYMFSIEAQGVAAANKAQPYGSNPGIEIAGPWMWVGTDTIAFRPATATDAIDHPTWKFKEEKTVLNDNSWQRLYYIAEVKEGEEVTAGFHFPVVSSTTGGRYSLRNPEFRAVGVTQEAVDHMYAYDQLVIQQNALKERLDLATEDNAKTLEDGYPWGHAVLKDSIDKFTAVYNDLLTVVDASGTELNADRVTLEFKDEILKAVQAMNSARNEYANTNKVYQTLVSDIAYCTETMNDERYASGDKATFKAAIDAAQALVSATQYDVEQVDQFKAEDDKLLTARQDFMMFSASRSNPVDLNYTLRNGGFETWKATLDAGSTPNYTSSRTIDYWNLTCGTDIKQWQVRKSDAYESGVHMNAWRGTTVGPNGKAHQVFNIKKAGVYEYRAKAYATDDTWSQYLAVANVMYNLDIFSGDTEAVNDTIYNPNIKLFFGPNGVTNDSIRLFKCSPVILSADSVINMTRYTPRTYSVIYVKAADGDEECELGFEAYGNGATAGANGFGFGDNHLYYLGSESAYTAATQAAFDEEVAKAKALIEKYKDATLKVGSEDLKKGIINSMYRYMGAKDLHPCETKSMLPDVVTLQDKQNSIISLQEQEALLELLATYEVQQTGISGTGIDELPVATGVFNLSGLKVGNSLEDLKGLGKGIYIVNGKKYLVK